MRGRDALNEAPEQPPGHSGVSYAGPPQPSSQLHASVSSAQAPWPEQSFGQPATAHASPRQPGSHWHTQLASECLPWMHWLPQ